MTLIDIWLISNGRKILKQALKSQFRIECHNFFYLVTINDVRKTEVKHCIMYKFRHCLKHQNRIIVVLCMSHYYFTLCLLLFLFFK